MKEPGNERPGDTASNVEWIGDDEEAILFDHETGGILGRYSHEGRDNWRIEVYVPPWREWVILEEEPRLLTSLLPFPKSHFSSFVPRACAALVASSSVLVA